MFLKSLRVKIYLWRRNRFRNKLLKRIINFSKKISTNDPMYKSYQFINKNGLHIFPSPFIFRYNNYSVELYEFNGFHYVLHNGKKLFFRLDWSKDKINEYYKSLLIEQDQKSAHLYCNKYFNVENGDVIIDLGSAEGNFSLDHIYKASRVILFEHNKYWIKPLFKTFEPYNNKVEIINKIAGSKDSETTMAITSLEGLEGKSIFIKIDVDGSEDEVLAGMKKLLVVSKSIKVAICTYHLNDDSIRFEKYFQNLNFQTCFSDGFMLFYHDKKIAKPYLRRGVLRAWKN